MSSAARLAAVTPTVDLADLPHAVGGIREDPTDPLT
jgi:hypothetical protein